MESTRTKRFGIPTTTKGLRRLALVGVAFSGTSALIYEVVWARELSLIFGSTVYAVSLMLAAFMAGLSLGSYLGGKWADRTDNAFLLFGRLELGIALFGFLTVPLLYAGSPIYFYVFNTFQPPFAVFLFIQLLLSFAFMMPPTTLMGATFPVVAKINTDSLEEIGEDVGNVYSINTLGSIAGALSAGFLLVPVLGVRGTVFLAAALNIAVAVTMIMASRSPQARAWLQRTALAVVIAIFVGHAGGPLDQAFGFYNMHVFGDIDTYEAYQDRSTVLFSEDDVHGRVAVMEAPDGTRTLVHSGGVEGSTADEDRVTTELFAVLPMIAAHDPHDVLVIGLGAGYTTRAVLRCDASREITTVEINAAMPRAATFFVGDVIDEDPRHTYVINDARNFLKMTDRTWHMITSEPSYPLSSAAANLFTLEHFATVQQRLEPDGIFAQWLPYYLMEDEDYFMMYKTFSAVFPNNEMFGRYRLGQLQDIILLGVNGDKQLDVDAITAEAREQIEGGITPEGYFQHIPVDRGEQAAMLVDPNVPFNTDRRPRLEFRAARTWVNQMFTGVVR